VTKARGGLVTKRRQLEVFRVAHINDCVPGREAKILQCGVRRVIGKVGAIVEVSRVKRTADEPLRDIVTVDVPGHGPVAVAPADIEISAEGEQPARPAARRRAAREG
jgi:hypothetical protein